MKNNFRKLINCVFILSNFFSAKAQFGDTIIASFHTKPKIFFQIAAYNSFVSNEPANTFGYRGGLEFNRRIRIGVGYYTLISDIVKPKTISGVFENDTTLNAQLDMNFIPLSLEYIFYNKDPWQISIPLYIGAGKSYFWYYLNSEGDRGKVDEKTVALMTMSAEAQYKIIKWVGVGAGLGYRLMLKDNNNINENFNSVIYNIGLRIFVDEIFKSIFKKKSNPQ
ncbi:MAG: hypothetical protein ACHQNT_01040 [Bacteroidia bacterium]